MISCFCITPLAVFAEEGDGTDETELDISLSSQENLFDIVNMKPGDWAPRSITVQNTGIQDFVYQMTIQNTGEEKLYNELLIEIKAGDEELYNGKLADFSSLSKRNLESSTNEDFDILIRFPEHLGNEFQGLTSTFTLTFTAEGTEGATVQAMTKGQVASVGIAPAGLNTAGNSSNLVNIMLVGSIALAGGIAFRLIRK